MYEHPHTIRAGGEQLTFVGVRHDDEGQYLEVRNRVSPGAGPPMHVHHLQEESLTVEQGTIGYQSEGGPERTAGPGETATFPAGEAHRFWAAGDEDLVCSGYVRPPDNIEYFLTEIYASTERNGGERPGMFDAAFLSQRYRSEFELTQIPGPVRHFGFPIIAAVGRLFGKDRRFADAPEPVTRPRP